MYDCIYDEIKIDHKLRVLKQSSSFFKRNYPLLIKCIKLNLNFLSNLLKIMFYIGFFYLTRILNINDYIRLKNSVCKIVILRKLLKVKDKGFRNKHIYK